MFLGRQEHGRSLFVLVVCFFLVVIGVSGYTEESRDAIIDQGTYTDDFGDPNSGWQIQEEIGGKWGYAEGSYLVALNPRKAYYIYAPIKVRGNNYSVQVELRFLKDIDGYAGVVFNRIKDIGSTSIVIYPKQEYFSSKQFSRGGDKTLYGWTRRKSINKPREINKIKIVQVNNTVRFYINDSEAGEGNVVLNQDDVYQVGVFVQSLNDSLTVFFDHFVVSVP